MSKQVEGVKSKADLARRIKALGKLPEAQIRSIVCALVGHSRIVSLCCGYVSCHRCDAQIGDKLAGCFDTTAHVIVGHGCATCDANRKALTWRDTYLTPEEPAPEKTP